MKNKTLLYAIKAIFSAFNVPATYHVFHDIFADVRATEGLVKFNTICAIVLIDLVFLWLLDLLENSAIDPLQRLPAALSAVIMTGAILWIGFIDESILAVAPRVSIIMIVLYDLAALYGEYHRLYRTPDALLQASRDRYHAKEAIDALRAKNEALEGIYPEQVAYFTEVERRKLVSAERSASSDTHESALAEGIYRTDKGYAWKSPVTGEVFDETSSGKPYTLTGAKQALTRHVNSYAN